MKKSVALLSLDFSSVVIAKGINEVFNIVIEFKSVQ